ncbi:glycosyltransferase family 4 protein [Halosimplex halobium]|uniref:glycosyltransferase family 4 protein n=1 Tax=Halosimplex halobium TaxID=3396618 RepID=UPI003F5559BD
MAADTQKEVVFVTQHYPPDKSGNAARLNDMTSRLSGGEWDITVLAPHPAFPHGEFDRNWSRKETHREDGITVHRLWAHQPTVEDPSFLSRIAYYITFPLHALIWLLAHRREFDVVITSSPPIFTGIAGLPFGLVGQTGLVVDVRDLWIDASVGLGFIESDSIIERVSREYQQLVLTAADRVGVTTERLGEEVSDQYGVAPGKIVHLPNGVETDRFEVGHDLSNSTIVYTGNVGHAQALDTCVRAMQYVDVDGARLKIVGDGDTREELEELTAEFDLSNKVEFVGLVPRDEVPEILSNAAIGLAPLVDSETLEYAVPTKAYEYMAASIPVIGTSEGELERLIETADCGVVSENEAKQLGDILETLLNHPEERERLGINGRTHVVENYDRRAIAAKLESELDSVVQSQLT